MKIRERQRCTLPILLGLLLLLPARDSRASIIGEENAALWELVGLQLEQISSLTAIVNNTRETLGATNDLFSVTRALQRTYQMIVNYRLEDLMEEAKAGLYKGFPELEALDQEIRMGVANVESIREGSDAFFTHWDRHDPSVGEAVKRSFKHGFKTAVWPLVFPNAMQFHPNPSPAEALVQSHYAYSGEATRRAIQRTAMGVLAGKIRTYAANAEATDNLALRADVTRTQLEFQTMQNTTDLLNLKEIEVAGEESRRLADKEIADRLQTDLVSLADGLGAVRGRR